MNPDWLHRTNADINYTHLALVVSAFLFSAYKLFRA